VVHLRPLRADDARDVLAAFTSDPAMARQGTVRDLDEAARYVAAATAPPDEAWALVADGRVVGLVGLDVAPADRRAWFWYWLHADARGRGWMRRAAATVADRALTVGGLERLELGHRANNPASGAVARAAGFVPEGVERGKFLVDGRRVDVLTYGRLGTDPFPPTEHLPVRAG